MGHVMKNRVTEMLGIRYPIVQGGMQWVGTALRTMVGDISAL
jgi:NAD(P)H-dependent flavin oxidoreductase YrpB (nitropropane dioxygenase family)